MIIRKILMSSLAVALASSTALAQTGRQLTTSPAPVDNGDGTATTQIFDTFWDDRCAGNISVTLDATAAPNTFVAGATPISLEDTAAAIDAGLQRWNANPSSFIDMSVDDIRPVPTIFLDFNNTASFAFSLGAGGTLGVSISTPLTADATFTVGLDIDGDGDSDVFDPDAEGVAVCTDIDGDGDIEYPAGDYAAGTILDNDVFFNALTLWETTPTAAGGADIDAVSTHEYGHSHGLTHSTINQTSAADGSQATMFPSIATFSPVAEEAVRTPHPDDLSASAFIYQEGSDYQGPAALQQGDVAFGSAFSVLEGTVTNAAGEPILSAAVSATNRDGEVVAVTYSGTVTEQVVSTATGATLASSIDDSRFRLAVPANEIYTLNIEALDGSPVVPGSISAEALIADGLGQTVFPEEGLTLTESSTESRFVIDRKVFAIPARFSRFSSRTSRLDFVLNDETFVENVAGAAGIGASIPNILQAPFGITDSFQFIEMFDRQAIMDSFDAGSILSGMNAGTDTAVVTAAPIFSSINLMTGTVDETTGEITLDRTVYSGFDNVTGQTADLTNLDFQIPSVVSARLLSALRRDENLQVFMVANIDDIPAVSDETGAIIPLVRPIITGPESGTSFLTVNGGPSMSTVGLFGVPVNWEMELRFTGAASSNGRY